MRIGAYSRVGYIAAGVIAIAAASGRRLVAQGGENVSRPLGAGAGVSPETSHLEPARGVLRNLVGTWRFEIWFAGNFGGAPDASGTRVVQTLFDDLRVQWTETLDHSPIQAQGIIGFDAGSGRFFSTSVSSAGSAPQLMTGTLDDVEPLITFTTIALSPRASFALTMLDRSHFSWAALDRSWRAVFTRQE